MHKDVASDYDDDDDEYRLALRSEDHIVDLGCSLLSVLHRLKRFFFFEEFPVS
jgi:hypothetical protein